MKPDNELPLLLSLFVALTVSLCLTDKDSLVGPGRTDLLPTIETPTVDVPRGLRYANHSGGSCVWVSISTLLAWQGQKEAADYIRQRYAGGEVVDRLPRKMTAIGMRFAYTDQGDVEFLDWSIRTRRGACVVVKRGFHMVNLVELTPTHAGILDNNSVDRIKWYTRESFLTDWRRAGGKAFVPVYSPPAPLLERKV